MIALLDILENEKEVVCDIGTTTRDISRAQNDLDRIRSYNVQCLAKNADTARLTDKLKTLYSRKEELENELRDIRVDLRSYFENLMRDRDY